MGDRLGEVGCRFDPVDRVLWSERGAVRLTDRECTLLSCLAAAGGDPVARDRLAAALAVDDPRQVDFSVRRLRAKIEAEPGEPRIVLTVHRHGYRLGVAPDVPGPVAARDEVRIGDAVVDLAGASLRRGGGRSALTALQLGVLLRLVDAAGAVVRREVLAHEVWGRADATARRAVDPVIVQLRARLEDDPRHPVHLLTVRGRGYRLARETPRTNLAPWPGVLVGRDGLLATIDQALHARRAVVLVGPGGGGKSRLAHALCAARAAGLPGGAWWVDGTPHRTAVDLLRASLEVLGVDGAATPRALAARLERRPRLLLLLDNVEHIVGVADALTELVALAPTLEILATSTIRLDVAGATTVAVPGLATADGVALYDAAAATAGARPVADRAAVAALVEAVDGSPLAIELAGRRSELLSPEEWLGRGPERIDALAGGAGRGRSVRVVIERSWGLATAEERQALVAARVFHDPFSIDALAAVGAVGIDAVHALVAGSWAAAMDAGPDRVFRLYEVVRDWLAARPTGPGALDSHARWFAARAAALRTELGGPGRDRARRETIRSAHDLVAAADHLAEVDPGAAASILDLLGWYDTVDHATLEPLVHRVLATRRRDPRLARLWLREAQRRDGEGARECFRNALATGATADIEYAGFHLVRFPEDPIDLGPMPVEPSPQQAWWLYRGIQALRLGRHGDALSAFTRSESLAARAGDRLAERFARSNTLRALEALGMGWDRLADENEALSAGMEAEGWRADAGRLAGLAAYCCAGFDRPRAHRLSERQRVLALDAGGSLENRSRWTRCWIELPTAPPAESVADLRAVLAIGRAEGDPDLIRMTSPLLALALARDGDVGGALEVVAAGSPAPRTRDLLEAVAAAVDPDREIPVSANPGQHSAHALELVAAWRGGERPSPAALRMAEHSAFLVALRPLVRRPARTRGARARRGSSEP